MPETKYLICSFVFFFLPHLFHETVSALFTHRHEEEMNVAISDSIRDVILNMKIALFRGLVIGIRYTCSFDLKFQSYNSHFREQVSFNVNCHSKHGLVVAKK